MAGVRDLFFVEVEGSGLDEFFGVCVGGGESAMSAEIDDFVCSWGNGRSSGCLVEGLDIVRVQRLDEGEGV